MVAFQSGDIVRVEFASPGAIDRWMSGGGGPGPGDVGVVKFNTPGVINAELGIPTVVTVTFPMLGTFGVHSWHLRLVQRAGQEVRDGAAEGG